MRQCFCPGVPIPAPCGAFQQSASSIPCSPPIAQSAAGSRPPPKPPSRPTRHLIPAQDYLNVIPAKVSPPFPQNSPSFPRRRESITEQPILNELARVCIPAKVSPPFPQNSPPFLQNSPSFPRRRESITEQPILNELARCGLLYAFPRGSVGTRKNKAPTGGAIISACPCCSCYFSRQAILGSQAVLDLRIHPGIGTELLPFNLVKTFYMPIVAIRLISWR